MTTMVEKVARVIYDAMPKYLAAPYDALIPEMQDEYKRIARTAIEAIREPTEDMRTAMRLANMNIAGGYGGPSGWEAAIETALKDERP